MPLFSADTALHALPPHRRGLLLHGLSLALRRLPAVLWTYAFGLGLALLFSARFYKRAGALMNHSLAVQRAVSGFDLAALAEPMLILGNSPGGVAVGPAGVLLYVAISLLLVPGTLFCYATSSPARLSTLLQQGLLYLWRFVRILLLTALVSAVVLGPVVAGVSAMVNAVNERTPGRPVRVAQIGGAIVFLLLASLLRLFFDLVEVYTVRLGLETRSNGKPDRRVREAVRASWRTLRLGLLRPWISFLVLALLGSAALFLSGRAAAHSLAQPRVWPAFLWVQLGVLLFLFTRFWQRGAETVLAAEFAALTLPSANVPREQPFASSRPVPLFVPAAAIPQAHTHPIAPFEPSAPVPIEPIYNIDPFTPIVAPASPIAESEAAVIAPAPPHATPADAIPDPEPAPPSLSEPDPGVFHHKPEQP